MGFHLQPIFRASTRAARKDSPGIQEGERKNLERMFEEYFEKTTSPALLEFHVKDAEYLSAILTKISKQDRYCTIVEACINECGPVAWTNKSTEWCLRWTQAGGHGNHWAPSNYTTQHTGMTSALCAHFTI
jgi:hypothetical protein